MSKWLPKTPQKIPMTDPANLLFIALLLDWFLGDPKYLWDNAPHPVVIFGKIINILDQRLNGNNQQTQQHGHEKSGPNGPSSKEGGIEDHAMPRQNATHAYLIRKGALSIFLAIIFAILVAYLLDQVISASGFVGDVLEIIIIWLLLAQKSLHEHVEAVASALRQNGVKGGREQVSRIVGRDPDDLDESGVSRAAIESLAENFCDGIIAPAFWYLVFGLPGLFAYKMINTADSMIGHKSDKYLYFGRAAARIDDLANWLPARISALLIGIGGAMIFGLQTGLAAFSIAMRDAGLHRSPNAGWPESAMAGICDFALGGTRSYENQTVFQAYINGAGKMKLNAADIYLALNVYRKACYSFWIFVIMWQILI